MLGKNYLTKENVINHEENEFNNETNSTHN